jgi:mannose-1-phosphate guanylyltransferase
MNAAYDPAMRAIILVGGEGTRLRPLTWRTPKALVPVLGRPLLEHLLLHLRQHGVTDVTLAMTQRSEAIPETLGDGRDLGVSLEYAYEETPLGSGGAIGAITRGWRAAGWADETFLVLNGDVVTDLDISAMLAAHRNQGAILSLSLHEVDDPSPFGVVDIDRHGRIHRFVEKPAREDAPSHLVNAGTWVLEPELIDRLDHTAFNRVEDGLFPALCEAGEPVCGFYSPDAYWVDVGSPAALLRVNLDMAADSAFIDESAEVARTSRVEAPAVVGARCRIGADTRITRSLLWDDVVVEPGAAVEDSILASGVRVRAGASISRSVIAHDAVVEQGAVLVDATMDPAEHEHPAVAGRS